MDTKVKYIVEGRPGNSLIRSSLIRSFRSNQMSDFERFAQIAQDKWATVSESLRSLRGNERMSDLLKKFWLKKSKILFHYVLFKV